MVRTDLEGDVVVRVQRDGPRGRLLLGGPGGVYTRTAYGVLVNE